MKSVICGEMKISSKEHDKTTFDDELVAEAREQSEAFARLYRRHYDNVYRYCVHRMLERHTAEDITSTVFLKTIEKMSTFDGGEQQFRNWLYRIVTNAVNDHLRHLGRRTRALQNLLQHSKDMEHDCPDTNDEFSDKLVLLKEAMLSLKPKYQAIITLRFFEKLKLTEIAEVFKTNPDTVRSQFSRALAKLRKKITSLQQEI